MDLNTDAPIALRKPKRGSTAISPIKPRAAPDNVITAKTPGSRRSKRVRFSDPSPFSPSTAGTGLTPALRRASLGTPHRKRPSTPVRATIEGHIQFTPFRQVLDERCIRRIRRNGLSDEQNQYEAEKKNRDSLQKELDAKGVELKRLRAELDEVKANQTTIGPDTHEGPSASQTRVDEIEAELEALRQSFSLADAQSLTQTPRLESWDHIPHVVGPSSDGGDTVMIHDDNDVDTFPSHQPDFYGDATIMGLEFEAARQAKSTLLGSFRDHVACTTFDFADSPARLQRPTSMSRLPETPSNFHHHLSKQLKETTNRAEQAEVTLTALDAEITALGFGDADKDDTLDMVAAIAAHFTDARLQLEHLLPGEMSIGFENKQLIPEILSKMTALTTKLKAKDRELSAVKDQHHNLKNNFERAIVAAENVTARVSQLEKELDDQITDTLHVRMRTQDLEKDLAEKEKDVVALTSALNKYRQDTTRLESLILEKEAQVSRQDTATASQQEYHEQRIDELEARIASETAGRRAAEASAVERLSRVHELQASLVSLQHSLDILSLSTTSTQSEKESQLINLNARISSLSTSLASANAEIDKLRVIKAKLEDRVQEEIEAGALAVESVQAELFRTIAKSNKKRIGYINGTKVRLANYELRSEELEGSASSDGPSPIPELGMTSETGLASDGLKTPTSTTGVRFAEWADVEVFTSEPDYLDQELDTATTSLGDNDDHIPGSVQLDRGRGRYKKVRTPKLVSKDARRPGYGLAISTETNAEEEKETKIKKRRYDSGIGLDQEIEKNSATTVRRDSGIMTPEMSEDGEAVTC